MRRFCHRVTIGSFLIKISNYLKFPIFIVALLNPEILSIFIEVSIIGGFYKESIKMDEIDNILKVFGFNLVLLGTDFNLTGNALYIKN